MAAPVIATGDIPPATTFNEWFINTRFKRKTITETVSATTTLQNDDDLFVSVLASASYLVEIMLIGAAQTTDDLKIGFTGPTGYSFNYTAMGIDPSASAFTGDQTAVFTQAANPIFGGLGGTNTPIFLKGLLVVSTTAGTFQLQWAQGTSGASGTSVLAGSYLFARRVE